MTKHAKRRAQLSALSTFAVLLVGCASDPPPVDSVENRPAQTRPAETPQPAASGGATPPPDLPTPDAAPSVSTGVDPLEAEAADGAPARSAVPVTPPDVDPHPYWWRDEPFMFGMPPRPAAPAYAEDADLREARRKAVDLAFDRFAGYTAALGKPDTEGVVTLWHIVRTPTGQYRVYALVTEELPGL